VRLFALLMSGGPLPAGTLTPLRQAYRSMVIEEIEELRGRNLACWCAPGSPCHAEILLEMANR
jgi:hypothetical protein